MDASPPSAPPDALPDADQRNWVDRFAPHRLQPWLKLGRFDRPAGAWLLMLPGWQGVALGCAMARVAPEADLMALIAIGALVMRAAGCAYNDIVDRDIDAQVARTTARPVASGRISVKGAWSFAIGLSLLGLVVLLRMNWPAIGLGVLSLGLVAAYPFMKRITWWPQAWLGLTFNWGALLAFAAVQAKVTFADLLLYAGGVAWTLGYDTIYALQDIDDDALVGVRSSARRLGAGVRRGVAAFYGAAWLLAGASGFAAGLGRWFYVGWAAYGAHLAWQAWRLRPADDRLALRLFRSNRDAGLLLFASLALGALH